MRVGARKGANIIPTASLPGESGRSSAAGRVGGRVGERGEVQGLGWVRA
eukprot:CAMPEP_0174909762 /NCGR_PEP_ID=MMETSP0167-20121228/69980_1 /TAXON_ID=38298 /ORGANISM="Rhodella maculata, Strain CCMP736" /LENGTH=48 /DNA_ID= /DNA_START= /DNA_END= /DNA_ORIENTATION=